MTENVFTAILLLAYHRTMLSLYIQTGKPKEVPCHWPSNNQTTGTRTCLPVKSKGNNECIWELLFCVMNQCFHFQKLQISGIKLGIYPGYHRQSNQIRNSAIQRKKDLAIPVLPQNREAINNRCRKGFYANKLRKIKNISLHLLNEIKIKFTTIAHLVKGSASNRVVHLAI